jgi:hypothetical protein
MILLLLLLLELIGLYLLSAGLTQAFYDVCLLLTRSRSIAVTLITLFTFPGTVTHELAHLFTAEVLGVHTGKLTLVPEGLETGEIKAGSVMISQTDPLRRYIIGLAPIFTGLFVLTAIAYFLSQVSGWGLLGLGYLLLAVSNSMFSSKEDLKGFIPFTVTLGLMMAAAYIAGLRIGLTGTLLEIVTGTLDTLTKSLGIVLAINSIGLILLNATILLVHKLTRRRVVHRS